MLMKLTGVVNSTIFQQKITNANCKDRKAGRNSFRQKAACNMFVEFTPFLLGKEIYK